MFNNPEEYLHAWLVYLMGALMLIGCWWYFSRLIKWRELRQLSRIIVTTGLLLPWYSDTAYDYLAPAVVISLVELLTDDVQSFWRAGAPLLVSIIIAISLSLCWSLWCWHRAKVETSSDQ